MTTLLDNDILLKCACYRLLNEAIMANCDTGPVAYLATARFVLQKRIRRLSLRGDPNVIEAELLEFLSQHQALETTPEEQGFAATLEATAQQLAVSLDTGESQLVAMFVRRAFSRLWTGDKRAIVAIERLLDLLPEIAQIGGAVLCLEQIAQRTLANSSWAVIRAAVCNEPSVDQSLSICFGCLCPGQRIETVVAGLQSYVEDIRGRAPRVLAT